MEASLLCVPQTERGSGRPSGLVLTYWEACVLGGWGWRLGFGLSLFRLPVCFSFLIPLSCPTCFLMGRAAFCGTGHDSSLQSCCPMSLSPHILQHSSFCHKWRHVPKIPWSWACCQDQTGKRLFKMSPRLPAAAGVQGGAQAGAGLARPCVGRGVEGRMSMASSLQPALSVLRVLGTAAGFVCLCFLR